MHQRDRFSTLLIAMLLLQGCAMPHVQSTFDKPTTPALHADFALMADGYRLPLSVWRADAEERAILLALHGLNDYRNGFAATGEYLASRGITLVAYDQRGFGESEGRGLWHGVRRLTQDLRTLVRLLRERYPARPLYLLGESMGGAVVLTAMQRQALNADGLILLAPAVWSRRSMPLYQRFALWLAANTLPSLKLTGEGLDLQPSDNIEMLRAMSRDPLVIKATRVDVLYGLSNLMDQAVASNEPCRMPTLILYGRHDDIIPRRPTCDWLRSLLPDDRHLTQAIVYRNGYHMLTRDLQAEIVLQDVADWIKRQGEPLPQRQDHIDIRLFCS